MLYLIIPRRNKFILNLIQKKKRKEKRKMPQELIKEFIGKVCSITVFNEAFGVTGKILAVEDNWLKVESKGEARLINGDMVCDIKILPAKYQK